MSLRDFLQKFKPKEHCFGLDIGSGSVKLAEVQQQSGKPLLKVMDSMMMQDGLYRDGQIVDQDALAEKIREFVARSGVSTSRCVFAVEGQHIFNRFINFPVMSKAEVLEAVKWDADKYIPYPASECYMDAVILGNEQNTFEMRVLLVAVPKEIIDSHVQTLIKAELTPVGIDFGALALGRIFMSENKKNMTIIFDIGASSTKMSFFKGQTIAFSRTMPFGGNRVTKAIQDNLALSWKEAETFKLHQTNLLQDVDGDNEKITQMRFVIRLLVSELKREINRSLEYYQMQNQGDILDKILFTGGGSLLPSLRELLVADLTGVQVIPTDLTALLDYGPAFDKKSLKSVSSTYGTALGLALWEEPL